MKTKRRKILWGKFGIQCGRAVGDAEKAVLPTIIINTEYKVLTLGWWDFYFQITKLRR